MKKRTKLVIVITSVLAVLAAIAVFTAVKIKESNEYYSHPIYYSYTNGNIDQSLVMVDDIEYKMGCILDENQIGEMIGFLDNTSYPIYRINGDTDKNFLYIKISGEMPGHWGFYRSDFIFSEVSADTVNRLEWWDATSRSTKTITDQQIISEFFDYVSSARAYTGDETADLYAQVDLYLKDAPGLRDYMAICVRKDGSFFCSFMEDGVNMQSDISADFIERIAG